MPLATQAWLLSLRRPRLYYQPVPPAAEELYLKQRSDESYTACPLYGSRKSTAALRTEMTINRQAVQRHMREMGLAAICPGPPLSRRATEHRVFPYRLRGLTLTGPNHVWGIDLTDVRLATGWLSLVAVLDWFSRDVLSGAPSDSVALSFVLDPRHRALAHATPQICKSDQGRHFTSPHYGDWLHGAGVALSMDGKGRALDNIFTERLWRTVKYEQVYLHDYAHPHDARQGVGRYFPFYNHQRPHQALNDRTPAEVSFARRGT